jgi:hypothetical protein
MNTKIYMHRSVAAFAAALVCLAGCNKEQETPPAGTAATTAKPAKPAIVSAEKNSFAEVTAKLDPGGSFYLYLSTEQVLGSLSNHLTQASNLITSLPDFPGTGRATLDKVFTVLGGIVKDSGVTEISGLGMSSIAREPGFYYSKFIVHHYPRKNAGLIWSVFGKSPHPLKVQDLLPEDTALAGAFDFDLALAWTNIVQAVRSLDIPEVGPTLDELPAQFQQATGLDLGAALKSLGGEYGVVLTLDTNKTISLPLSDKPLVIPNPGLCLVVKVNSDLIFDRVDKVLAGLPGIGNMVVKTDEAGLKMRTVPIPLPLPVEVHPCMARVGDYLLLATSDTMVRDMVAVQAGQKKGFKTTETFKQLSRGVPIEGNNFSLVTGAFGSLVSQLQEFSLAAQNDSPEMLNSMRQLMQDATNRCSYSVGANGPDGWEGVGNGGSLGAQKAASPAVAVAGPTPQ